MKKIYNLSIYLLLLFVLHSCTTYKSQYGKNIVNPIEEKPTNSELTHRFYLIGDAGNAEEPEAQETLKLFEERLKESDENATLVFLGDNIYPKGMPTEKGSKERKLAEEKITFQLEIAKNFKGKTVFIAGNHDWYNGIEGLEAQSKFVTDYLEDKKAFLPRNSCGIERLKINDDVVMITIDSQWFLEDWNNYPTINDDCEIKTKEAFFEEVKSLLNKHQNQTVILAIHHPLLSNGEHGGQMLSINQQLYTVGNVPLPVVGSVFSFFRKTIGIPQDIHSAPYSELANRIKTEITNRNNVIVVSGHEHNLQYIENENIKQIISGAGSKTDPARVENPNDFSYGKSGYAVLDIHKDATAKVRFYGTENSEEQLLFTKEVLAYEDLETVENQYDDNFPPTTKSSIYTKEMTDKSKVHKFLFGELYRDYYGKEIEVPNVLLDTLYGGLKPLRAGGGMQSNSLRLADKDGKEYSMRSLKKNTTRFLQSMYNEQYVIDEFEETGASDFLYDFYTSANPFYPFILKYMAKPIGVNHTQPQLFYVPKQNALGKFNNGYGDEFYMIEERPMTEQSQVENFGKADDIISTSDLMLALQKNEKSKIDEEAYIKARLFDMLLGDWDRHQDQWRWAEHKQDGFSIFRPIPRDRDQAFAKFDGALLKYLLKMPLTKHMQNFHSKNVNLKWLNRSGYVLDLTFLNSADEQMWLNQARFIQENLTDEVIENAFAQLPSTLQDETSDDIIQKLKKRRNQLDKWAVQRYEFLQKQVVLTGTDKKERFEIIRKENGQTEISIFRIKKDGEELVHQRTYSKDLTNEIWIYGLDDNDIFEVKGISDKYIKIRLIGGQNNDTFSIENGKNIIVYDYKSKKNKIESDGKAKIRLTDNYNVNNYDYSNPKYNAFFGVPNIGYNPDDGVKLGANFSYEVNKFNRNPYSQKHNLSGMYYFATNGFELGYKGIFKNVVNNTWDLALNARFTSPNFSINYFGYGNETTNNDKEKGMNYNRVRMENLSVAPELVRHGRYETKIAFGMNFERIKVEDTFERFVSESDELNPDVFHSKHFGSASLEYAYSNYDNNAFPTLGFTFSAKTSWHLNLENTNQNFASLVSHIGFTHKLIPSGKVVLLTLAKGEVIFNDNFEFYQGAFIGGNNGLRGFRNERFLGRHSFYHTSDVRWEVGSAKGFIPVKYGISGGYDYGRVWASNENSNRWHNSYGGGLWLNAAELTSIYVNYFHSNDSNRFTFGVGFNF